MGLGWGGGLWCGASGVGLHLHTHLMLFEFHLHLNTCLLVSSRLDGAGNFTGQGSNFHRTIVYQRVLSVVNVVRFESLIEVAEVLVGGFVPLHTTAS